MARIAISSVGQFLALVEKTPAIYKIPAFNVIRQAMSQPMPTNCNCSNKKVAMLAAKRELFESAISVLSEREQAEFKRIVGADQICYNKKEPNGQIKLFCF